MSCSEYSVNAMIAEQWYRDQIQDRECDLQKIEAENGHCIGCESYNASCSVCSQIKRAERQMLLLQNAGVVAALKIILQNCEYLEYDEEFSKYWGERFGGNKIKIKITDPKRVRKNRSIARWVRDELCQATGIQFPRPQASRRQPYFYISLPERFYKDRT